MAENLKDIVARVFRRANWDPSPTPDAVDNCEAFVNDALQQLSLDCPIVFFEERVVIHTDPDASSGTADDTVTLMTETTGPFTDSPNPWVFELDIPFATNGVQTPDTGQVIWGTPDTPSLVQVVQWAGRKIDVTTSDGVTLTSQIRSAWATEYVNGDGDTIVAIRFSVVEPWPWPTYGAGPFTYRVYWDDYWLPDDVIEVKSAKLLGNDKLNRMQFIGQAEAEEAGFTNNRSSDVGQPTILFRGQRYQMPAPSTAPDVSVDDNSQKWFGPEPAGEFEYCYTYCWGRRYDVSPGIGLWRHEAIGWIESETTAAPDADRAAVLRRRDPLWESSPSPISDAITVDAPTSEPTGIHGNAVVLTFPNYEYQLGYYLSGLTSQGGMGTAFRRWNVGHSGIHIRIYRRRKSADFSNYTRLGSDMAGQSVTTLTKLEQSNAFHLIYELRIEDQNEGQWIDNGGVLPDQLRRLKTVNGYQGIRMWPRPDDHYDIELRVLRRPAVLVDPTDAPPIHSEGIQLIVDYAAAKLYELLGEHTLSQARMADYKENLLTLTRRFGDIRPDNTPIAKRMARAWGYTRGNPWRRPRGSE